MSVVICSKGMTTYLSNRHYQITPTNDRSSTLSLGPFFWTELSKAIYTMLSSPLF